ncbi:hypothetical protein RG963_14625 [Methanosarcina sp. Z-7115]|uniref:Uncharacterized protein n=1 Tax=Methanosarcina baikalica TaxID=3073890 RepID=A0ABU2D4V5_9EURY|nr:hypothetical protein [Methanosarcina sp. Z-7115]MDR7666993.1 hypothetical protein [Methanosarcina sp. Z-7115]
MIFIWGSDPIVYNFWRGDGAGEDGVQADCRRRHREEFEKDIEKRGFIRLMRDYRYLETLVHL